MPVHLIASCTLCKKPIEPEGCWRGAPWAPNFAHALCLAAYFLIADEPSRSERNICDEVNDRADELCALLCENPAHASSSPGEN